MLAPPPLTPEFVGMAGYALTSFHDLVDDEVESDGSSISDVVTGDLHLLDLVAHRRMLCLRPSRITSRCL